MKAAYVAAHQARGDYGNPFERLRRQQQMLSAGGNSSSSSGAAPGGKAAAAAMAAFGGSFGGAQGLTMGAAGGAGGGTAGALVPVAGEGTVGGQGVGLSLELCQGIQLVNWGSKRQGLHAWWCVVTKDPLKALLCYVCLPGMCLATASLSYHVSLNLCVFLRTWFCPGPASVQVGILISAPAAVFKGESTPPLFCRNMVVQVGSRRLLNSLHPAFFVPALHDRPLLFLSALSPALITSTTSTWGPAVV